MYRVLYFSVIAATLLLAYTIYSQDLKVKTTQEYSYDIVIYTKADCNFCEDSRKLLEHRNLRYSDIDITWDKERHNDLYNITKQATVPYIFINGKFIGGYSEFSKLVKSDEFDRLLH